MGEGLDSEKKVKEEEVSVNNNDIKQIFQHF